MSAQEIDIDLHLEKSLLAYHTAECRSTKYFQAKNRDIRENVANGPPLRLYLNVDPDENISPALSALESF
jgi:hypothetical protein